MKKWAIIFIFLVGIGVGYFIPPGESKEVMIGSSLYPNPEDLPRSNGMIHHPVYGSYPEKVYWRKRDLNRAIDPNEIEKWRLRP